MAKGLLHISPSSVAPHNRAPLLGQFNVMTQDEIKLKLIKITQHEKKLLFNCSSRVYQGLMKLKFRANPYLSLFTCNSSMCRYKNQTHIRYIKFLSI